jgi:hypothetical protein
MSRRRTKQRLERWHRYFRRYPWHLCTPGILRAYDRAVAGQYAGIRHDRKREERS